VEHSLRVGSIQISHPDSGEALLPGNPLRIPKFDGPVNLVICLGASTRNIFDIADKQILPVNCRRQTAIEVDQAVQESGLGQAFPVCLDGRDRDGDFAVIGIASPRGVPTAFSGVTRVEKKFKAGDKEGSSPGVAYGVKGEAARPPVE
jgi:hypothetical protein